MATSIQGDLKRTWTNWFDRDERLPRRARPALDIRFRGHDILRAEQQMLVP